MTSLSGKFAGGISAEDVQQTPIPRTGHPGWENFWDNDHRIYTTTSTSKPTNARPKPSGRHADYFFYRAAQAAEMEQEYSPDLTVIVGDFRRGKQIVKQDLYKLQTRFDTEDLILYFTDKVNFRKGIDENYKGNRTKRKPCGYLKLKNWGMEKYPSLIMPTLEADDALGIAATSGEFSNFVWYRRTKTCNKSRAESTTSKMNSPSPKKTQSASFTNRLLLVTLLMVTAGALVWDQNELESFSTRQRENTGQQ